jgi:hypothetical protein
MGFSAIPEELAQSGNLLGARASEIFRIGQLMTYAG